MAVDRDNKLMSVLAARRDAFRGRLPLQPHRKVPAALETSNSYSGEQKQSFRMECEKNCTSNFTTRASAGCMRKCANLHKVEMNRGFIGLKHLDSLTSVRKPQHNKETNTIIVDELLDTEESQSTGQFILHPRDRYATNESSDTKDLNSTNNFNRSSSSSGTISSSIRNNIIENEVRQTSTEKVYSKYAASRMAAAAATAAALASGALDSRHKRIDPAKLRQRTSLVPDRSSVEDSDLVPYQFFGQKLSVSKVNDTRIQVTNIPRKTPLSAMLIPTKASSKPDDDEIMETSVSKQPLSWDRGKVRRLSGHTRNIVALNRKFGGNISRAEFEALTNYPLNATSSERMSLLPSLNQKRIDDSIALSVAQGVPNISRLVQRVPAVSTTKQPEEVRLLTRDQVRSSAELATNSDEEQTKIPILIHVPDPEPAVTESLGSSTTLSTTTSTIPRPLTTIPTFVETTASLPSSPPSTTAMPAITTSIPVTTVSPTVTPTFPTTTTTTTTITTTTTTAPLPTLNPNVPLHPLATPPPFHVEETPNLIEFITNASNPLAPATTTVSSIAPPSTESAPRVSSRLPPIFTRTTVSSSVRSTINPAVSKVTTSSTIAESANPASEAAFDASSVIPNIRGMNSKMPSKPTLFAITMKPLLNAESTSSDEVFLQSSDNSEVTIEMHRMNMATYVLAGLGMFPVVAVLLYLAKSVLFRKSPKSDGDLERYISEEHKKISPVVRLEYSGGNNHQSSQPQSIYSEGSIMTEESFNRNLLKFKSLLGEGNFGQVWKAEADDLVGHMGTTRIVAVKTERCGVLNGGLRGEAAIMKKLGSHSNVVTLLGACTAKG